MNWAARFPKLKKIRFPWSKPTTLEVLDVIFGELTAEELEWLDSKNTFYPNMYQRLIERADYIQTRRTLKEVRRLAEVNIFPFRHRFSELAVQESVYCVLFYGIFSQGEYIFP